MEKGVHFCVFPEYSISAAWITEIRDKIHQQASPQSIFCLPLEHIPLKNLTQVLLEAGVKETNPYLVEFPLDRKEGILNLCWILAKGEDGALCSHFQAKLYPALAQEEPRLNKFQGGQVLRVFTTDNEKPLTFAILVCFDFIAGGHGRPSPVATLQDDLTRHRRYLDWLLVPQFNPKPAHPEFERVLDQFYQHHHCRATVVAGVNVTGGFDHPLRARGPFGGSSLVGRLSPTFKSRITFGRLVAAGGGQVQLYIIAEEDLLVLYADRFPTTRAMSTIGEGRKYRLQFYYHFAPDTGGLEQWTLIKNPQTPPWAPGFYRKHCDFFRGLVYRFERELQHHLTRSLPHPVPYVDLILEQGEIPPELPPRLEQERKKQLPHHVERE